MVLLDTVVGIVVEVFTMLVVIGVVVVEVKMSLVVVVVVVEEQYEAGCVHRQMPSSWTYI